VHPAEKRVSLTDSADLAADLPMIGFTGKVRDPAALGQSAAVALVKP
jgi:hypothetical protein